MKMATELSSYINVFPLTLAVVIFYLLSFPLSFPATLLPLSRPVPAGHSSRRVHFERINTVPVKGQRAARHSIRKHHSLSRTLLRGTADWFGVSKDSDATQKWQRKSLRHCSLRYGKLKPQVIREMDLPSQDNISLTSTETPPPLYVRSSQHGMQKIVDPLARGRAFRMVEEVDGYSVPPTPITPGAASLCSFTSSRSGLNRLPRRRKRESVAKMSFRAAAALVK
ncbi:Inactive rhomboid protein 1, partial [Ataeniobius toweri]|nr:Inactive rhomboid protein 1 [Ataeniobius toweri]